MSNTPLDLGYRIDGRVAVVTGAAGDMGSAICRRLGALGASIVLLDLSLERLKPLEAALCSEGVPCLSISCDISSAQQIGTAAAKVQEHFGRCDILVNNAGILHRAVSMETLSDEAWDLSFAVNVRGAFLCSKHFGLSMLAARSGVIVNIGSTAASLPTASAAYGVSKTAILGLTKQLAVEWGPRGIRANTVSPGFVITSLSKHLYDNAEVRDLRTTAIAVRRIGTPEDIASAVGFLASDAASYITAQEIKVDGGFSATSHILTQPQRQAYAAGEAW